MGKGSSIRQGLEIQLTWSFSHSRLKRSLSMADWTRSVACSAMRKFKSPNQNTSL